MFWRAGFGLSAVFAQKDNDNYRIQFFFFVSSSVVFVCVSIRAVNTVCIPMWRTREDVVYYVIYYYIVLHGGNRLHRRTHGASRVRIYVYTCIYYVPTALHTRPRRALKQTDILSVSSDYGVHGDAGLSA